MNISEEVIKCCETVIFETRPEMKVNENTVISRDSGIDSLGMVSLILELEDKFECDLDDYLADIRKCKTISELINIMFRVIN